MADPLDELLDIKAAPKDDDLSDIRSARMTPRPFSLGNAVRGGLRDIGRMGMAPLAAGEQIVSSLFNVPDGYTPFSDTLKDMALTDENRQRMAAADYSDPSLLTQTGEGAVRSGVGMVPGLALGPVAAMGGASPLAVNAAVAAPGFWSASGNKLGNDLNDPSMTPFQRLFRAGGAGAIEFGTELVPMGKLGMGAEGAFARAMANRGVSAPVKDLVSAIPAQAGQEGLAGFTGSIFDDLTNNTQETFGDVMSQAGSEAGMGALTSLPVTTAMSGAAGGAQALRDRQLQEQMRQQEFARQMQSSFDPNNAQALQRPIADLPPLQVTPEVIREAQANPGVPAFLVADAVSRQRLLDEQLQVSPEEQAQVGAIAAAMTQADDTVRGQQSLRAADEAALQEQLLREQIDNAIGRPGETAIAPPEPVVEQPSFEQNAAEKLLADQTRVTNEREQQQKRRDAYLVREDLRSAESGVDVGSHAYGDDGKLTVDADRPNRFLALPPERRTKAVEKARKFVQINLGDDLGEYAGDDPTASPAVTKYRMENKPLPESMTSGVRTSAPPAKPTAADIVAMAPADRNAAFSALPADERLRIQPEITRLIQEQKKQQVFQSGIRGFNDPAPVAEPVLTQGSAPRETADRRTTTQGELNRSEQPGQTAVADDRTHGWSGATRLGDMQSVAQYPGHKLEMFRAGAYDGLIGKTQKVNRVIDAFGGTGLVSRLIAEKTGGSRVVNDRDPGTANFHEVSKRDPAALEKRIRELTHEIGEFVKVQLMPHVDRGDYRAASEAANAYWKPRFQRFNESAKGTVTPEQIKSDPVYYAAVFAIEFSTFGSQLTRNQNLVGTKGENRDIVVKYNPDWTDQIVHRMRAHSDSLSGVQIVNGDAGPMLDMAGSGDIVPVDGPYVDPEDRGNVDFDNKRKNYKYGAESGKKNLDLTTVDGWRQFIDDHVNPAAKRGAGIIFTNYWNEALAGHFRSIGFTVEKVGRRQNSGDVAYELVAYNPGAFPHARRDAGAPQADSRQPERTGSNPDNKSNNDAGEPQRTSAVGPASGPVAAAEGSGERAGRAGPVAEPKAEPVKVEPGPPAAAPGPSQPSKEILRLTGIARAVLPSGVNVEPRGDHIAITYPGGASILMRSVESVPLNANAWYDSAAKSKEDMGKAFSRAGFGFMTPSKEGWKRLPKKTQQAVMAELMPVAMIADVSGDRVGLSLNAVARLVQPNKQSDAAVANAIEEEEHHFTFSALLSDSERTIIRDDMAKKSPELLKEDPASRAVMEAAYGHWKQWRTDKQKAAITPRVANIFTRLFQRIKSLLPFLNKVPHVEAKSAVGIWEQLDAVRGRTAATPGETADEGGANAVVTPKNESLRGEDLRKQWSKATGEQKPKAQKTWQELKEESDAKDRENGREVAYATPREESPRIINGDHPVNPGVNSDAWLSLGDSKKNRLAESALRMGNQIADSAGKPLTNPQLMWVDVNNVTPSQSGEDYDNESSRSTAKSLKKVANGGEHPYGYDGDMKPIIVDDTGVIIDGNHRHAAATFNGDREILAWVGKPYANQVMDKSSGDRSGDTIEVDGVQRPTNNSNGKPIAKDEESIRNFYKWFGDSHVVDDDGRPLVTYHASTNFTGSEFKKDKIRPHGNYGAGFYFTTDEKIASEYAGNEDGGQVLPVYLSLKNPVEVDTEGWVRVMVDHPIQKNTDIPDAVVAEGFDSVFVPRRKMYVALEPSQIKSAIGNRGTFSAEDNNISYAIPQALNDIMPSDQAQTFQQWQDEATTILSDEKRIADVRQRAQADAGLSPAEQVAMRRLVSEQYSEAVTSGNRNRYEEALETASMRKASGARAARELAARRMDLSTADGRRELLLSYTTEMGERWQTAYKKAKGKRDKAAVADRWQKQQERIHKNIKKKFDIDLADPRLGEIFADSYSLGRLMDAISDESGDSFHVGNLVGYYVAGNLLSAASMAVNMVGYPLMGSIAGMKGVTQAIAKHLGQGKNEQVLSASSSMAGAKAGLAAIGRGLSNGFVSYWTGHPQAAKQAKPLPDDDHDFSRSGSPIRNPFIRAVVAPFLEANRFVDEMAWTVAYNGALAAAAVERKQQGDSRTHEQIIALPEQDLIERACKFADWFTLRGKPESDAGKTVFNAINTLRSPTLGGLLPSWLPNGLYFIMPFFNAIANLTIEGVKMSPYGMVASAAGVVKRSVQGARSEGIKEKDTHNAKALQNFAYLLAGVGLLGLSLIPGDEDEDEYALKGSPREGKSAAERSARFASEEPRTFNGLDVGRLDPASMPAFMHADLRDAINDLKKGKGSGAVLRDLGEKTFNAVIQRNFLSGLSDLFVPRYNEDGTPKGIVTKYADNVTSMVAPGRPWISSYRKFTETERMSRERGGFDSVYDSGKPRRNVFGETEKTRDDTTGSAIKGLFFTPRGEASEKAKRWQDRIYDLNEKLRDAGEKTWYPAPVSRAYTLRGVPKEWTDAEYDQLQEHAGKAWLDMLEANGAIAGGNLPSKRELQLIQDLKGRANARARQKMMVGD